MCNLISTQALPPLAMSTLSIAALITLKVSKTCDWTVAKLGTFVAINENEHSLNDKHYSQNSYHKFQCHLQFLKTMCIIS